MKRYGIPAADDPRYVYRFFDSTGKALYVGCTANIAARLSNHWTGRPWFGEVVRIEVDRYPDEAAGLAAERECIETLDPIHNRTFTAHDTPRRRPCRKCHRGRHNSCMRVASDGNPCQCSICARAIEGAAP